MLSCLSHDQLFVTLWTVACEAPLSMGILQARTPEWVAMPSSRKSSHSGSSPCLLGLLHCRQILYHLSHQESACDVGDLGSISWLGRSPGEGNVYLFQYSWGFPGGSDCKESACNAGDLGLIPGSGRSPGEGNGYRLQYFCLENSMDQRSLVGSNGKESACNAGDLGSVPALGRFPGGGHGNPLQYSCLEDPHGQRNLVGLQSIGSQRVGHN